MIKKILSYLKKIFYRTKEETIDNVIHICKYTKHYDHKKARYVNRCPKCDNVVERGIHD